MAFLWSYTLPSEGKIEGNEHSVNLRLNTFPLQLKQAEPITVWIAVSEDSVTLLELQTMAVMCRYNYANIVTFGGCLDDFMLVACPDEGAAEQKLLFALSKPKVYWSRIHLG